VPECHEKFWITVGSSIGSRLRFRETGTALVGFDFPVESPLAMLETVVFPIFTAFPLCDRPRNGTASLAQKAACTWKLWGDLITCRQPNPRRIGLLMGLGTLLSVRRSMPPPPV